MDGHVSVVTQGLRGDKGEAGNPGLPGFSGPKGPVVSAGFDIFLIKRLLAAHKYDQLWIMSTFIVISRVHLVQSAQRGNK